ncbi:hypothetical protein BX600DRAFT_555401 [Xylariales sp. PMI_506]|nr:hypothetical protein BX600DRAFT_555401 [Xylariales sp. PMI_506]
MSALSRTIRNTTEQFLKSYVDAGQAKNPRLLSATLAEDCVRYIGPASFLESVGAPADFSMTNAEYEAEFGTMEFYTFEAHEFSDLTIDTENLKAAVRSVLTGVFFDKKPLRRQFVWFLDFNQDGTKIVKVYQNNDVEEGNKFRDTIRVYKAEKQQAVAA